jgi:lysozyme
MTPNRKVIDISHHNPVTSWQQVRDAGIIGVIAKATQGDSFRDDQYIENESGARSAGLKFGAYHFGTDDDVVDQIDNFLNATGIDDDMLYALDWEEEPNGHTMSLEQAREFLELLEQRTGRKGVLYSGNLAKEAFGDDVDPFFGAHRLWLAQYGNNPEVQASWKAWWLWQYSDGVAGPGPYGCPGVSGDVDTNSWAGTDDELRAQWSGLDQQPKPKPDEAGEVIITITFSVRAKGADIKIISVENRRTANNLHR